MKTRLLDSVVSVIDRITMPLFAAVESECDDLLVWAHARHEVIGLNWPLSVTQKLKVDRIFTMSTFFARRVESRHQATGIGGQNRKIGSALVQR